MYALGDRYFIGLFDLIARNGFLRAGIVFEQSSFHETVRAGVLDWAVRMGVSIVADVGFNPQTENIREVVLQSLAGKVDCLIISVYAPDAYEALEALKESGTAIPIIGMPIAPVAPDFARIAGSIAQGIFAPSQWEPMERLPFPGTTSLIKSFTAKYSVEPTYHAASAFAACRIIEISVTASGTLDNEIIASHIRLIDTVTEFGRFKLDTSGIQVGHSPILIQWQDGEKQIVYPRSMRTAEARFPR